MDRKWLAPVVAGIAGAALTAWILTRSPAKQTPRQQMAPQAASPDLSEVSLPGKIRAQHVVEVPPPQDGIVEAFLADVGQEVSEGQLLARVVNRGNEAAQEMATKAREAAQSRVNTIESSIVAARLEASRARADASRARSEYDRLERAYRRQAMLFNEGATPKAAYEKTAREHEQAGEEMKTLEAVAKGAEERVERLVKDLDAARRVLEEKDDDLENAKARVGASELQSPVAGLVIGRTGDVGEQVAREKKDFFQIAVDLSLLDVVVEPEPPVQKLLKAGQPALILIADLPGEGILGTVKSVAANESVVEFRSPSSSIRPGGTAQVRIKVK